MPWEAPGPWVGLSALLSLGRNISGFELPLSVYEGNTFTTSDGVENNDQEILLCARLRNAPIESSKPWDGSDFDSEEGSEDETYSKHWPVISLCDKHADRTCQSRVNSPQNGILLVAR